MYNFTEIEKKWQKYWDENNTFVAENNSEKPKYYYLVEFPYPSGSGLHVGHARSYSALDAMARKKRMMGYNVLFPIGWDAFGSPAEQYAIKNKIHPKQAVLENIKTFKGQLKKLGISFDYSREFSTTDPEYYKWTQWQFLQFFNHGLAYKDKKNINWCNTCKTGLSNEDSSGGVCERCGDKVVQKEKEQWVLKMSMYADKLIEGLDETDFQERIKIAQINWIGKSCGAEVLFDIKGTNDNIKVYTTRPDTIYGTTFMVIAPEHPIIEKYKDKINNYKEIKKYQNKSKEKSEFERIELSKDKTGVKIDGLTAVNPVTKELVQIWISDYVMMNYGTGAIMAVPAHDERDYEFAKKFGIEIKEVIKGGDISKAPYIGEGEMINSGILNGITSKNEAIEKMITYLKENNIGEEKTNYRLQDWIFSRQRFWGEPIPLVHCDTCGWVPVPDNELPVLLPDVAKYEPTEDGESPLALITDWVNTTCPNCSGHAVRETDTMPNWAGSSWYWLRYMDAKNNDCFASKEALDYWGMVDYYNGGMEHATRHLLYARFWHRFLYDIGLVPTKEPFKKRVAHGMILGEDGQKMSKSKGNVVNPDDMINLYGADALRCYELFIGDYEKEVIWNESSLNGCKRFLDRVYKIGSKLNNSNEYTKEIEIIINKTIKKVTEDIENMKYNTAVSALMILLNEMESLEHITKKDYRTFLHLLNPIAPHITEELNEKYDLGNVLCNSLWPVYDENKLTDETYELIVQVNGKVRGKVIIPTNSTKEEMEKYALGIENVKIHINGKEIIKLIVIPSKMVNIVVK
ncbi:MAG TPA: leucine--tRNA ligase [Tenericutes bacterium]|nr:leucine--tRNA ligase [Mycoplasmatota bacterium]